MEDKALTNSSVQYRFSGPQTSPAGAGHRDDRSAASRLQETGPASVEHDVLAETLRAIRLTGSVFLNARFSKPFGIITPDQFDAGTPLAHLRHVSIFHLLASGSCTVEIENGERRTVSAGDILLLPFATTHKLWSGDCAQMAFAPDLMRPGPVEGLWTLDHGGGGETTRMVCGFIESSEFLYAPVFQSLPPLLVDRTGDDKVSAVITSTVREILLLADAATPGAELMLGRLMELLFVEVLRRHASQLPDTARGWFAALNDPIVGRDAAVDSWRSGAALDGRRTGARGGHIAQCPVRAIHCDRRPAADRVPGELAYAARRQTLAQHPRQPRGRCRRRRL